MGPKNAFFQNVHFRGPNWVGGAWYGIFLIREKPALRVGLLGTTYHHMQVPDGVGQGDEAIALEEYHTKLGREGMVGYTATEVNYDPCLWWYDVLPYKLLLLLVVQPGRIRHSRGEDKLNLSINAVLW